MRGQLRCTTGTQRERKSEAISPQLRTPFSSRQIAVASSVAAPWRAITTTSRAGLRSSCLRRNHSRIPRLTRFLATAPPTRLLTVTPNRGFGVERPGSRARSTMKWSVVMRCPTREARWNSRERRRREVLGNRSRGLPIAYFEAIVTTSRLRPLARRRLSTSRPPFVRMRARNPCTRFRRILLG